MGMFDSLIVQCPKCQEDVEFQSKAGPCNLNKYDMDDCSPSVAVDLIGQHTQCQCGAEVIIKGSAHVYLRAEVYQPKNGYET